jgi:DNA-binding CsgD family transcriptional regulator
LYLPDLVGRDAEIACFRESLADVSRSPQMWLIGGETGIGKTRFAQELLLIASTQGAIVASGGCVENGTDGLPFAPFCAVLRVLVKQMPGRISPSSVGYEDELTRLMPECGLSSSGLTVGARQDRIFAFITRLFEDLSADRTLVVVLEDLHWADSSTRYLLMHLFRTLRSGRVIIIGTYRSDDIHSRHFMRSFLTEVDRLRRVRHIRLPPLTKKEVRQQLTAILGVPPEPITVDRIFRRSDGNAFFVEELANSLAGAHQADLNASLRDLLLTGLHALSAETQRLLRTMAEGGEIITDNLLKTVTALPETDMLTALRSAVDACFILPSPDNDGYRFRHLLVREAVSADLLPGERRQINRIYAEALEADPSLVRADEYDFRLAIHWYEAHEPVKALPAILKAATEARRHRAHGEQVDLLEHALDMWDETTEEIQAIMDKRSWPEDYPAHPHPCAVAPRRVLQTRATFPVTKSEEPTADDGFLALLRKLDLMAEATVAAYLAGDHDRSMMLARRALSALKERQDPLYSAWFWIRISCLKQESGNGDGREELTMAENLVHGLPPSVVHTDISTNIASWEALNHPGPESLKAAELSRRYARNVGAKHVELHARLIQAVQVCDATLLNDDPLREVYRIRDEAEARGAISPLARANINLVAALDAMGRSRQAIEAADHGITVCRTYGLPDAEARMRFNQAASLLSLGHWHDVRAISEEAENLVQSRTTRAFFATLHTERALLAGHLDEAQRHLENVKNLLSKDCLKPSQQLDLTRYALSIAAGEGRTTEARELFLRCAEKPFHHSTLHHALPLLYAAAAVETKNRDQSSDSDPRRAKTLTLIQEHLRRLPPLVPAWAAYVVLVSAELQAAQGKPDPNRWHRAVAAYEVIERPYELALARRGFAAALLQNRTRSPEADALIAEAHLVAVKLGALPLADELGVLRAQLNDSNIQTRPSSTTKKQSGLAVLTARELEVLHLIARGYSNRRIGHELHISVSTVSIHVSHILAKLKATNRTEAAGALSDSGH